MHSKNHVKFEEKYSWPLMVFTHHDPLVSITPRQSSITRILTCQNPSSWLGCDEAYRLVSHRELRSSLGKLELKPKWPPITGGFPSQRATNAASISMPCHHVYEKYCSLVHDPSFSFVTRQSSITQYWILPGLLVYLWLFDEPWSLMSQFLRDHGNTTIWSWVLFQYIFLRYRDSYHQNKRVTR